MYKTVSAIAAASLIAMPAQAANWREQSNMRPGAFIGAQVKLNLGGNRDTKPTARLAIAPTQSRISGDGMVRTRIGEGVALNFSSGTGPTITLAGTRADLALGLRSHGQVKAQRKLGISTAGWAAIGVGTTVLGLVVAYVILHHEECQDEDSTC